MGVMLSDKIRGPLTVKWQKIGVMLRYKPALRFSKWSMSAGACTPCWARGHWPLRTSPFDKLRMTSTLHVQF